MAMEKMFVNVSVEDLVRSGGRGRKKKAEEPVNPLWGDRLASKEDIRNYRMMMLSVNKMRVSETMVEAMYLGASIVEYGIEKGELPLWVLRKFERWVELWYGKGGVIGFPKTIVAWRENA